MAQAKNIALIWQTNIYSLNMKQRVIRAISMCFMLVSLYSVYAQTKIAKQNPDGKFEIIAEQRSVRKIFVNLFSNEMGIVEPVNIGIKQANGTVDLQGAIFLTAESHIGGRRGRLKSDACVSYVGRRWIYLSPQSSRWGRMCQCNLHTLCI